MANAKQSAQKAALKKRRKLRVRKKIQGTPEQPRLSVFRSAKNVSAQVIDDLSGKTLVSISSFEKGSRAAAGKDGCGELGKKLAERCKAKDIGTVVFDRNGNLYHGRVKAFADGAREGGLKF